MIDHPEMDYVDILENAEDEWNKEDPEYATFVNIQVFHVRRQSVTRRECMEMVVLCDGCKPRRYRAYRQSPSPERGMDNGKIIREDATIRAGGWEPTGPEQLPLGVELPTPGGEAESTAGPRRGTSG